MKKPAKKTKNTLPDTKKKGKRDKNQEIESDEKNPWGGIPDRDLKKNLGCG